MKTLTCRWVKVYRCVLLVSAAAIACSGAAAQQQDDFRWEDVQPELRALMYPQHFLDSVQNARGVNFQGGLRQVPPRPFMQGEVLVYEVSWGLVHAGYGIVSLTNDSANRRLVMTAEGMTNDFVSAFYRVRDYLMCVADAGGLYPFYFEEHLREGRYKANRWILFDHPNGRAWTHKSTDTSETMVPFSQSLVSLFYYLRTVRSRPGDSFRVDCFVQKKNYSVGFRCVKREKLRSEIGEVMCLLVEPTNLEEGRVFTSRDKFRLWFTDDDRAIPVLLKSKVKFGSITARLVRVQSNPLVVEH